MLSAIVRLHSSLVFISLYLQCYFEWYRVIESNINAPFENGPRIRLNHWHNLY